MCTALLIIGFVILLSAAIGDLQKQIIELEAELKQQKNTCKLEIAALYATIDKELGK